MDDLIVRLFKANVSLGQLSDAFGYDEDQVLQLLENPDEMIVEEKKLISRFLNEDADTTLLT